MADTTDAAGGELLYDGSGENHFVRRTQAGERLHLSTEIPASAPPGSLALKLRHVPELDTPATDRFGIGPTGEFTVELWYRPETLSDTRAILVHGSGKNGWRVLQAGTGLQFGATNDAGETKEVSAPDVLADSASKWTHLAVTIDKAGKATIYQDGKSRASGAGFTGFKSASSTLRLGGPGAGEAGAHPGEFQVDDLRISDVALPAGEGTGKDCLAWKSSLSASPNPGERPKDLGKRWVRSHPFMLNSYGIVASTDADAYIGANLNCGLTISLYQKAAAAGYDTHWMGQQIRSYPKLDDPGRTDVHIASNAPRMTAYFVRDEPSRKRSGTGGIDEIVKPVADYVRSIDSKRIINVNAFPSVAQPSQLWGDDTNPTYTYEQYLDDLMTIVRPDVLMYDHYPFRHGPTDLDLHFHNLMVIRAKAAQYGVPFFAWVQSFQNEHHRLSSESELRFQLFTLLAAGAKGFSYFIYDPAVAKGWTGLRQREGATKEVDGKETPSAMYAHTSTANAEVLNLGKCLRFLESTDLRYIPGSQNPAPKGLKAWSADDSPDSHLRTVRAIEGNAGDALLGFFVDDDRASYVMIVNLKMGPDLDAAAAEAEFDLTFDPKLKSVWCLDRATAKAQEVSLDSGSVRIRLPGGTGELFKFGDGEFAGLVGADSGAATSRASE